MAQKQDQDVYLQMKKIKKKSFFLKNLTRNIFRFSFDITHSLLQRAKEKSFLSPMLASCFIIAKGEKKKKTDSKVIEVNSAFCGNEQIK